MLRLRDIADDATQGASTNLNSREAVREQTVRAEMPRRLLCTFSAKRPVPGIAAASVSYPAFAELNDRDQEWQKCGDASRRALRLSVPVPV